MADTPLRFRHEVIDPDPPGSEHDITLIADINGDGRNEIIIGGKKGPPNLFWYENPTWRRHDMAAAPDLEAGGVVLDVNGNGRLDLVAGQQLGGNELYWFENPADPAEEWTKRVIEDRFEKYHDQAVADIDGDGKPEIIVASQKAGMLVYYDIPDDPRVQPWPRECCHVIDGEAPWEMEGLQVVDVDGDGQVELIAGPVVYKRSRAGGSWAKRVFAPGFVMARVAAADVTGDGRMDIVICEGESHPGRLAICSGADGTIRVLRDDLFHPHSLALADFTGSGRLDIFVAEMGLGRNPDPRMFIYRNRGGGGDFEEVLIQEGVPTHEAKVGDLTGNGRCDIIGKPYHPERHIDVWFNES